MLRTIGINHARCAAHFRSLELWVWRGAALVVAVLGAATAFADEWRPMDAQDELGRPTGGQRWVMDSQQVLIGPGAYRGCFALYATLPRPADFPARAHIAVAVDAGRIERGLSWSTGRSSLLARTELCHSNKYGGVRLAEGQTLTVGFPLLGGGYHTVTLAIPDLP